MFKRNIRKYSCDQVLRDWYGDEHGMLEVETKQPPERKIDNVLDDIFDFLDKDDRVILRKILDSWPELVGQEIYHHASPRKINNKILVRD